MSTATTILARDAKERADVYAQFDKVNKMIFEHVHARDIDVELNKLSALTRIRREIARTYDRGN